MYPSATLCRAQEAIHLDRANGSALENVRAIAVKAAKAWGIEALAAEAREARGESVRLHRLAHPPVSRSTDHYFGGNPDRSIPNG
ncbi:MAG: hypothetical protein V4618_10605 [Pseudomonadota bacterium]